jgi:glyoxylase-like metal-dependent hydrolase (beta-lactamase superfamily II)
MRMRWAIIAGFAVALSTQCEAQTNRLAAAAEAMGAANLNSIQYTGSGSVLNFGQAFEPGERWPRFIQRVYDASVNYQTPAMRLVQVRSQGEHPPRGGGAQAVAADQRTVQDVSGKFAWQEAGNQAVPNPAAVEERLQRLWATPHGVIKAALANAGKVEGDTITVNVGGRDFKATLNAQNLVEKVSYLSTNEVVGDYPIEIAYTDYADFGGVKFPRHIVQNEDGHPTFDIVVNQVRPNAAVAIDVPANVQQATPAPLRPTVEKLADGVWYFGTPNARNWAVEFKDYVVVVEGIGSEARSLAVMDEIAKLVPNKPIRYVINTHAHYDHAGGLRTYVAKGATVVTHETNKPFFEKVWARPRTIAPDMLSKSPRPAAFETVSDGGKKVMTDGTKTIELYHMKGTSHNVANLLVYMPNEKLVYWADGYNPPEGNDPRDFGRTPEQMIDLYRVITMNNLDVRTIAPAHGAGARPFDNLKKAIGLVPP